MISDHDYAIAYAPLQPHFHISLKRLFQDQPLNAFYALWLIVQKL